MELVLTLLAVILLVVLPVGIFLLAVGGLFYAISRTIRGEKAKDRAPSPSSEAAGKQPGASEPVVGKRTSSNGRRDA